MTFQANFSLLYLLLNNKSDKKKSELEYGTVVKWLNTAVCKTVIPWVRIPPVPPPAFVKTSA